MVNKAKTATTYEACDKAKADYLLGTTYRYKIMDYFFMSTVDCEVSGFLATSTGVKWVEKKPLLIDKDKQLIYVQPHETVTNLSTGTDP